MKKTLILLLFIPFAVFAQDNTEDAKHQEIIMSVLQQINEYESASSFAGERRITQFQDLFVDLNTQVVNDIPAIGDYEARISIENYISKMRKHYIRIGVDIEIHEISKINFIDDNKGDLSVFLTKKVRGPSTREAFKISEKYDGNIETDTYYIEYEDEFELEMKFEFNNGSVLISDIILAEPKGRLLVIAPHSKKGLMGKKLTPVDEIKIVKDGVEIQLSGYFYSIPNVTSKTNISISSADETLIGSKTISLKTYNNTDETHMFKLPFTKTMGDVHVFGLLAPSFLSVNSNSYKAKESNLSSTSYGLSISYSLDDVFWKTLEAKKKKKMSLYVKGGLIKDNFDYELTIPTFTETYADIDSDGGSYERTVLLENFSENQIIDLQSMFIQLESRIKAFTVGKWDGIVSISVGIGHVITVNSATYSNSADATYSGYYEDLFGITMAENGVYDFGNFNVSQTGDLDYNTNVQTLLADVSGMLKVSDRWVISGGIMYTKYQTNIFNLGTERVSNDSNELNTINNLVDVDMSHISLKVGVSYKF